MVAASCGGFFGNGCIVFRRLLIANRGEIACRVARTARRMGLRVVAVHSEADAGARHVRTADESVCIGPARAQASYLDIDALIEAARRTGAEAVHPGYGFLSENAEFAERAAGAGLAFVGPPAEAIRAMGSKSAAKKIAADASVPLVPGYHEPEATPERLAEAAAEIGYPVLVKASAGGGGRGMRIVERAEDLPAALAAAEREANAAFGDGALLLERYIARPRHVEVQVLADMHGAVLHLLDRDCSIQRRHQKVIEEAPAPRLPDALRAEMGEAAVRLARAIGYVGAGTVEFLVEGGSAFHFIEMNTRLQVEHPVTEMVTGLDLVEWQLRIAAGEPLAFSQEDIAASGHAVEARLYAEDPARGFLPQTGRLAHLAFPEDRPGLRIDSGVETGDAITPFYDPMIAKVVAWGEDRERARLALADALADTRIAGLNTNLFFLETLARHPSFAEGALDTHFIETHGIAAVEPPEGDGQVMRAMAAIAVLEGRAGRRQGRQQRAPDRFSPWGRGDAWRLNSQGRDRLDFDDNGEKVTYETAHTASGYRLEDGERSIPVAGIARGADGGLTAEIDGRRQSGAVIADGNRLTVFLDGARREILFEEPGAAAMSAEIGGGRLTSPMPGTIVRVLVEAGQAVSKDEPLIVLEAMKMEHTIAAPADGTVESLPFAVGDRVEEGVELVGFKAAS